MQGLPFAVRSVANCIPLQAVSLPHHAQPGLKKKGKILSVSTTRVSHKQTFSRDACAIKKEPTLLQSEYFALHGFTVVSHGSGFLNSIETAAERERLLNSIEKPLPMTTVFYRGF